MELKRLILEKIEEFGEVMLDGFFPAKYPEARLWRELLGGRRSYKFSRPTFSAILSQLRSEGFIERKGTKKKAVWSITKNGLRKLHEEQQEVHIQKDGIPRIVSFDIPEPERKKRRWIREALFERGYKPLQKSVWIGFSPLPKNFFEDLDLLTLRDHIHIFSIGKMGTIKSLHF
jgi:DNA-binding transcriptional regulator PaaX